MTPKTRNFSRYIYNSTFLKISFKKLLHLFLGEFSLEGYSVFLIRISVIPLKCMFVHEISWDFFLSLFLILSDFEPRCSYKNVLLQKKNINLELKAVGHFYIMRTKDFRANRAAENTDPTLSYRVGGEKQLLRLLTAYIWKIADFLLFLIISVISVHIL